MSGSGWYYVENEARIGPVESSELERLISQGTIGPNTLVWRDGMAGWEEAGQHFTFAAAVSGPPPIAPAVPASGGAGFAPAGGAGGMGRTGADGLYEGAPARGFGEAISVCFSKFVTFSGRASRSEYWYFVLFSVLVGIATGFLDAMIFGPNDEVSPINAIASLILFLPGLSAAVRRLHDTNRSGWWIGGFYIAAFIGGFVGAAIVASNPYAVDDMMALIAILGIGALIYAIVILVFLCQKGEPGPNRFG